MDISVNIQTLKDYNITIDEYIYLKNLYVDDKDKINDLFKIINNINEDSLQDRGFIKITDKEVVLRQKTIELFEPKELFYKFLSTFPIKTPSGRYLSPARIDGVAVQKLKKKWDTLFKHKNNLEEKAILVLEAELSWRKKTNQLEYINAMEAWLNGNNYEKYEYLLDEENNKEQYKDWM